MERDRLNSQMGEYRYFCSETFENENYDYSTPTYDDSNYSSSEECSDADNDGYCDVDPNYYESEENYVEEAV